MRKRVFSNKSVIATLISLAAAIFAAGEGLSVGDEFPKIEATDQHEKPYAIEGGTKYVLVSYDMGPGKQANGYLNDKGAPYLPENNAVFIANIRGMPSVIANTFAIPKMRKYAHRILLANEAGLLDEWPQEKGQITVFALDESGKISEITYWSPKSGDAPF